jgi:hypothetical protein
MLEKFVHPDWEGASPCPSAAQLLSSHDTDSSGKLSATEAQAMAFAIMPCVQVRVGSCIPRLSVTARQCLAVLTSTL